MFRVFMLAAIGSTLLVPLAQARFVLLDAIFDDKPLDSAMGRQGARFEEPFFDPGDSQSERIVQDSGTDYSVRIRDRVASGTDALTWAFKEWYQVTDGQLNISLEIRPDSRDAFEVTVTGIDPTALPFFRLVLDHSGTLSWADGNDLAPTSFGSYGASDDMVIGLAFDLAARTYTFTFNGFPIRTSEAHGAGGGGIARLRVGNSDDDNTLGFLDLDNLFIDHVTGSGNPLLLANFNDQPLNALIGTGGAELGQPVSYQDCVPTVETGVFPTPSMVLRDLSTSAFGFARFEFLQSHEVIAGDVSLAFVLIVNQLEYYNVYLREQGASARAFLSMDFTDSGTFALKDEATPYNYQTIPYGAGVPIHFELGLDMSARRYYLWVDGQRFVYRKEHGILDRGVGALIFGTGFDANLLGGMRVDDIRVQRLNQAVSATREIAPPRPTALALGAIPNPFHPSAALRFGLAEPGLLRVEIIDLAGRRLAVLADRHYSAGDHTLRWNGDTDSGRPLATGVYFTRLTLTGASGVATARRKLVLLK